MIHCAVKPNMNMGLTCKLHILLVKLNENFIFREMVYVGINCLIELKKDNI